MAITFVNYGSEGYGTGNVTVGVPSGVQQNDFLLILHSAKSGGDAGTPSGWTQITGYGGSHLSGAGWSSAFWKIAGASESSVTITEYYASGYNYAIMLAFRGVDTNNPFDVSTTSGVYYNGQTSVSLPGYTTQTDNAVVVWFAAFYNGLNANKGNNISSYSNANMTNLTKAFDYYRKGNATNATGIGVFYGWKTSAGATGSLSVTFADSEQGNARSYALRPHILNYTLTIYYKYSDGTTAATTYSSSVVPGDGYNITSPTVSGYTPDQLSVSGTVSDADVTVTVTYYKNNSLTIYYKKTDESTAATTHSSTVIEGDAYSIPSPSVSGYSPGQSSVSGTAAKADITVTVYYYRIGTLTIYYQYSDTSTAYTTYSTNVTEGNTYSVDSPTIAGFHPDTHTVSGTMGTSDVTETVYYTLNPCQLTLTPTLTKIGGSGVSSVSVSSNINAKAFEARATLDGQSYGRGIGTDVISDDLTVDASGVHTFTTPTTDWSFDIAYTEIATDGTYRISVYAQNTDDIWST